MTSASTVLKVVKSLESTVPSMKTSIFNDINRYMLLTPMDKLSDSETDSETELNERIKTHFFQWTHSVHNDLGLQRQERLRQVKATFIVALTSLIVGMLLVFIGTIFIFAVSVPVGSVTAIASIISSIVSALAFKFNKEANDRVDTIARELIVLAKADMAMQYIYEISDAKRRDKAIEDLARNMYAVKDLSENQHK